MKKNNKKGFTIVELVIVIAVIAILAAVLIPTFISLLRKSRVSTDTQLIKHLNTALALDADNEHNTVTDAFTATAASGFDVAKINAKVSENEILWDSVNDVFCYLNDGQIEYLPDSVRASDKLAAGDSRLWKIYDKAPLPGETYSMYVAGQAAANYVANNEIAVGVDCGDFAVPSVRFVTNADTSAVIRTNSLETELTVNAPNANVAHYGKAKSVNVVAVKPASYVENGYVPFVEVAQGRVVFSNRADVDTLYLNKKVGENAFDDITIKVEAGATMPTVKRDSIGVELGEDLIKVCVVETVEKTETIYLKGNGTIEDEKVYVSTTGDANDAVYVTEVTASTPAKQIANAKVGEDVVDNGSTAQEKEDTKAEVVDDAQAAEVAQAIEEGANYVARIGSIGYTTLASAVAAAVNGDTVVLLQNVTQSTYITINDQKIAVDLNGKEITTTSSCSSVFIPYHNNAELTVKDSVGNGKIIFSGTTSAANQTAIRVFKGTFILESGTIGTVTTATSKAPVYVQSTGAFVMNGGEVYGLTYGVNNSGVVTQNGGIIRSTQTDKSKWSYGIYNAKMVNLNGGTVQSTLIGVYMGAGTLTVDGGTIESNSKGIMGTGTVNVKSGTVRAYDITISEYKTTTKLTVNVSGGAVISDNVGIYLGGTTSKLTMTGGDVRAKHYGVNALGDLIISGGSITVEGATGANNVALCVRKSLSLSGAVTIQNNNAYVEVDESTNYTPYAVFVIGTEAAPVSATIDGATIASADGNAVEISAYSTVTLKNATVSGVNAVITQTETAACTIESGVYTASGSQVCYAYNGTFAIAGGTYTGGGSINPDYADAPYRFTLNCYDSNYAAGTANFEVTGGSFYQFNPSNDLSEGANTCFTPEGYASTYDAETGYYTVAQE